MAVTENVGINYNVTAAAARFESMPRVYCTKKEEKRFKFKQPQLPTYNESRPFFRENFHK